MKNRVHWLGAAWLLGALGVVQAAAGATPAARPEGQAMTAFLATFLPPGFREVARQSVRVDGDSAEWVRWQAAAPAPAPAPAPAKTPVQLGGEHFSVVWATQGYLKGFADMRLPESGAALPGQAAAQAAADAFLRTHAPDLLHSREVHWIKPHDETLHRHGRAHTLAGMKVKMRNRQDGRWFWVIVGAGGRPIVFERDIVWLRFPGKRQTEQWLHDDWLAQRGLP